VADGPVIGWGYDYYGQSTPPAFVNGTVGTASAIAASDLHTLAIQATNHWDATRLWEIIAAESTWWGDHNEYMVACGK